MKVPKTLDPSSFLGRAPEWLSLDEQRLLSGWWIALEIYSPRTTPLRRIEALGKSAAECSLILEQRGLDPREYECVLLRPPY